MKIIKNLFRLIAGLIIICILYLVAIIVWGSITDYQPDDIVELTIKGNTKSSELIGDTVTFLSWNIGFCGLGAEMDFFYDGGEMVHPTKDLTRKYLDGISGFLMNNDSIDIILLQEVDQNSARTKKLNEVVHIAEVLPNYLYTYANNYDVKFVPVPFTNPLGKVEAGQMNLSRVRQISSSRYAYHSAYSWPKRLFMLDRCFIESRFELDNGKQLVVMNTHNSAYDAGGKMRDAEMPLIRDLMLSEYKKGNFVVAGGDWNQNPPDYDLAKVDKTYPAEFREILDGGLFPNDWHIVYDPQTPTNREIDAPLKVGKTTATIIDYYILSPNVKTLAVKTINENFQFSDHQPVYLKIELLMAQGNRI